MIFSSDFMFTEVRAIGRKSLYSYRLSLYNNNNRVDEAFRMGFQSVLLSVLPIKESERPYSP